MQGGNQVLLHTSLLLLLFVRSADQHNIKIKCRIREEVMLGSKDYSPVLVQSNLINIKAKTLGLLNQYLSHT